MALAIDASTKAITEGSTTASITSASFSPPAGSLFAVCSQNATSAVGFSSVSDNLGSHLTYTKLVFELANGCGAEIWVADCAASQTNMTVTGTWSSALGFGGRESGLQVIVFTGAAPAATQVASSHTKVATNGSGTPSAALTAAASTSWIIGSITNFSNQTGPTVPGGQTDSLGGVTGLWTDATDGSAGWTQGNTAVGNSNLTINDTAPTAIAYSMVVAEILAATVTASGFEFGVTPPLQPPRMPFGV